MAFVLSVSRHLTKAMQPIAGPRPARLCFMSSPAACLFSLGVARVFLPRNRLRVFPSGRSFFSFARHRILCRDSLRCLARTKMGQNSHHLHSYFRVYR
jgi:hypothetical protein